MSTFVETFHGHEAQLGKSVLRIFERYINTNMGIPQEDKHYFKGRKNKGADRNRFLTTKHQKLEWIKGLMCVWMKE